MRPSYFYGLKSYTGKTALSLYSWWNGSSCPHIFSGSTQKIKTNNSQMHSRGRLCKTTEGRNSSFVAQCILGHTMVLFVNQILLYFLEYFISISHIVTNDIKSRIKWVVPDFMMTSSNENIFRVTGPLYGEFTGHRWIPLTKASDAELWCFLSSAPG